MREVEDQIRALADASFEATSPVRFASPQPRQRSQPTHHADMEVVMFSPPDRARPRRRWLPAGAAVAVLVAVGLFVSTVVNDDSSIGSDDVGEALALAQQFVAASDAWDGETVRSLLADDAAINGLIVSTVDEFPAAIEYFRATGQRQRLSQCIATGVDAPIDVTCTYTFENAWSEALDVGPFTGSRYEFVIADGKIQESTRIFNASSFSPQVWSVFTQWLRENHPNDVDIMIAGNVPQLTPAALALWQERTTEFVSSLRDS